MKGERTLLIVLGCAICIVCAGVVLLTDTNHPTVTRVPDTPPIEAAFSGRSLVKGILAEKEEMAREMGIDYRLLHQEEVLAQQKVEGDHQIQAIENLLGEEGLTLQDEISLYKRVAKIQDKDEAIAFFDDRLRSETLRIDMKSHALSLLAQMGTPEAEDAIWEHFQRVVNEPVADDEQVQLLLERTVRSVALMAQNPQTPSASATADKILLALAQNRSEGFPGRLRVMAIENMRFVRTEAVRDFLGDLATEQKTFASIHVPDEARPMYAKLAILTLGKIGTEKSFKHLAQLEETSTDFEIRLAALNALGSMGSRMLPVHERGFISDKKHAPAVALQQAVVSQLVTILERKDDNPKIRSMAIVKLGSIDSEESSRALATLEEVEGDSLSGQQISAILNARMALRSSAKINEELVRAEAGN